MDNNEGKVWALITAMKFVISLGLQHVKFEVDCKIVVDKIIKRTSDAYEFGDLIHNCIWLLELFGT